jgi:MFS family permease
MRQMQNLYHVYELSGSAFQLGLTGLAQGIPLFAVGIFAGTLADFIDRRKLLLLTIAANFLTAATLAALTLAGAIQVWHIIEPIATSRFCLIRRRALSRARMNPSISLGFVLMNWSLVAMVPQEFFTSFPRYKISFMP